MTAYPLRALALALFLAAAMAACTASNSAYCDEQTPCEDPAYPYCDLTGAYGAKNACVMRQVDATPPDAPVVIDAAIDRCADVDCSDLTDDCNVGVCDPDTGTCLVEPIPDDEPCGAVLDCTEYSECDFNSTCAESGVQTRTCTPYTCQAGICSAGQAVEQEALCNRDTDGNSCGSRVYSQCSTCAYSSTCDESGSQTCTCTDYECSNGVCEATNASCNRSCSRQTDGLTCNISPGGQQICCSSSGACNTSCN